MKLCTEAIQIMILGILIALLIGALIFFLPIWIGIILIFIAIRKIKK